MRRTIVLLLVGLVCGGCSIYDDIDRPTALAYMHDAGSADHRRTGISYLVTRAPAGTRPPLPATYRQLAKSDPDFTVRAMAIRCLNVCRDQSATPIFVAGLGDPNVPVRLESAKALANVPDPAAVPGLLDLARGVRETVVNDHRVTSPEDRDVRVAAADALRQYPTLDVERTLIAFLNDPEFAVAWQSRQSLVTLTGHDLAYDEVGWLRLLTKA